MSGEIEKLNERLNCAVSLRCKVGVWWPDEGRYISIPKSTISSLGCADAEGKDALFKRALKVWRKECGPAMWSDWDKDDMYCEVWDLDEEMLLFTMKRKGGGKTIVEYNLEQSPI
ncbi:MAG: hypothetical protein KKE86_07610 [Planctomycetes bacterium]|nr:hypothetical protein [Planctomycetota bacterium]MBU4399186.1 hypothetical protein [Planctomycetota bacterium]MCG2682889.1 hypothetical protein [Planctomycetales bacterium]